MKTKSIIFGIAILFFTNATTSKAYSDSNNENEDFYGFFWRFSADFDFQLSRITFPLQKIGLNYDYTKIDTVYLSKEEWTYHHFYHWYEDESYNLIYDNFEHKLRDTGERVYAKHGNGNGIREFYYFKRINGLWYLIKIEDLST